MTITVQDKFEWQQVAVAGIAAGISEAVGLGPEIDEVTGQIAKVDPAEFNFGNVLIETGKKILRSGISHLVEKSLFGTGKFNFAQVAADAFGNALGEGIVGQIKFDRDEKDKKAQALALKIEQINEEQFIGFEAITDDLLDVEFASLTTPPQSTQFLGGQAVAPETDSIVDNTGENENNPFSANSNTADDFDRNQDYIEKATALIDEANELNRDAELRTDQLTQNALDRSLALESSIAGGIERGELAAELGASRRESKEFFTEEELAHIEPLLAAAEQERIDNIPRLKKEFEESDVGQLLATFKEKGGANSTSSSDVRAAVRFALNRDGKIPAEAVINFGNRNPDDMNLAHIGQFNDRHHFATTVLMESNRQPGFEDIALPLQHGPSKKFATKAGGFGIGVGAVTILGDTAHAISKNENRVSTFHMFENANGERFVQIEKFFTNELTTGIFEGIMITNEQAIIHSLGRLEKINGKFFIAPDPKSIFEQ